MNTTNFKILAAALNELKPKFTFAMNNWALDNYGSTMSLSALASRLNGNPNFCGTAACALGFSAYLVEKPLPNEIWWDYMIRVYGVDEDSNEGMWVFSAHWYKTDDTQAGAAARIEWMLEHGVPDDFHDQIHGRAPLCYRSAP